MDVACAVEQEDGVRKIGDSAFYDRLDEIVATDHTALLIVDMQNDFASSTGHFARYGRDVTRIQAIVPRISRLIALARRAGVSIIYTRQTTAPAQGSDSPAWLYFKTRDGKSPDYTITGSWGAEFVPELAPGRDVAVVEKHRPSAFLGTDLDHLLRQRRIETIVVAGCLTQGCVQATVMDGSFHDYYAVVVGDCVESTSAQQHVNALRFLESRYDVISSDALENLWRAPESGQ
jgi:nicotinamidase-related amidase